ncbi:MAG: T9SS type A sorting domain-containing protein, partial [Chitinophagaceae bacterium]
DATGNVYITGSASASSGGPNCATLKYGNDGVFQWLQTYNGPTNSSDAGNSLAVDGSSNVFVTGYSYNSSGRSDVLTAKYNSAGAQLWLNIYDAGSGTQDVGKVLALDAYGNAYVAAETSVPGVVNSDFLTIRYSSSGVQSWAARYNGPENQTDYPTALAVVIPNGPPGVFRNAVIYVTGYIYGDVVNIKYSQPTVIGGAVASVSPASHERMQAGNFNVSHYPNPALAFTNISYELPADSKVTITLYDALGRKISTFVDGSRKAGMHTARLNTTGLHNGIYHYQYIAHSGDKEFRQSKTLIIQKPD